MDSIRPAEGIQVGPAAGKVAHAKKSHRIRASCCTIVSGDPSPKRGWTVPRWQSQLPRTSGRAPRRRGPWSMAWWAERPKDTARTMVLAASGLASDCSHPRSRHGRRGPVRHCRSRRTSIRTPFRARTQRQKTEEENLSQPLADHSKRAECPPKASAFAARTKHSLDMQNALREWSMRSWSLSWCGFTAHRAPPGGGSSSSVLPQGSAASEHFADLRQRTMRLFGSFIFAARAREDFGCSADGIDAVHRAEARVFITP